MTDTSIKIKNYKCFSEESGFECIKRVNVIIGRNNCGKSSLLDMIYAVSRGDCNFDPSTWRSSSSPEIIFESFITDDVIKRTFPENVQGGGIDGFHYHYGMKYINRYIKWKTVLKNKTTTELIYCNDEGISPSLAKSGDYANKLANNMTISIKGKIFKRTAAERDIVPEEANNNDQDLIIKPNGAGITRAIQCFINRSNLPSYLVEKKLLSDLNKIFAHDANFTDIVCQQHDTGYWEIYLEEGRKGRIALSKSGSGLKTIIMVLVYLHLIPHIDKQPLNNYLFAFEELENNIHPSLLRRLTQYIYEISRENDFSFFLTTHSNVLIDQFSKQEDAQIVHVTHENGRSVCLTAKTYIHNHGILDDLDVRASDILQANGIIWVEGPSDRIYLNHWIKLWSGGKFKEGTHYQILMYGGRLLSHLSAESPDLVNECISILEVNRNAIILIDSDRKTAEAPLNNTKNRIIEEFNKINAFSWVTNGKEIENYIPKEAADNFFKINSEQVDQYQSFFAHIDKYKQHEGTKFSHKKSLLAENIISYMTIENLLPILDLDKNMTQVCKHIYSWNS